MKRVARHAGAAGVGGHRSEEWAAAAERVRVVEHARASRTVAGHALDVGDCRELLAMLGLSTAETQGGVR
jgi:hypothetical protein